MYRERFARKLISLMNIILVTFTNNWSASNDQAPRAPANWWPGKNLLKIYKVLGQVRTEK